jgi:hypothetical protein
VPAPFGPQLVSRDVQVAREEHRLEEVAANPDVEVQWRGDGTGRRAADALSKTRNQQADSLQRHGSATRSDVTRLPDGVETLFGGEKRRATTQPLRSASTTDRCTHELRVLSAPVTGVTRAPGSCCPNAGT